MKIFILKNMANLSWKINNNLYFIKFFDVDRQEWVSEISGEGSEYIQVMIEPGYETLFNESFTVSASTGEEKIINVYRKGTGTTTN